MSVAVLFARRRSVYHRLGVEVYDDRRDARTFELDRPVVAHPPCRSWGRYCAVSKGLPVERDLALFAIWAVRHCGGVLEHPMSSALWRWFGIRPGCRDQFGGVLVPVDQGAFGHPAPKLTGLYFVRCPLVLPDLLPLRAAGRVEHLSQAARESTPVDLAVQLVASARQAVAA